MLIEDDSKIFGSSSIWFSTPKTAREVLARQKLRRQRQKPAQLRCFASGIPQGRHLQMPGRSWQAGQPSGDGKPVGPDVPP